MTDEVKMSKIVTFNGKKTEWALWSEKFKARANRKGYKGILLGEEDCEVPEDEFDIELVSDDDERKKLQKLRRLNEEDNYMK